MNICILGRQPAIGLAELESLYGSDNVTPLDSHAALVDADIDFARLGGTVKTAKWLTTLDSSQAQKAFDYCRKQLPELLRGLPAEGKVKLGVSLYGLDMPVSKINANVLSLKKVVKNAGRSVRAVPNTEPALSSAQTYHNALTSPVGMELVFIRSGDQVVIGQVTNVQDIDAYTLRDRSRPKRDAFVGMLPPKLAQTIVNLAVGEGGTHATSGAVPASSLESDSAFPAGARQERQLNQLAPSGSDESDKAVDAAPTILDPFCGTGVVLMEAALMGYGVYGTDLSEKMVRYTRDNMNWLHETYRIRAGTMYETADATDHIWRQPVDFVACEGFLGQPLGGQTPTPERLQKIVSECDKVMRGFLDNIHEQLKPSTRLCIAMPAWFVGDSSHHLPVISELTSLGYTRLTFTHASNDDLIYRRDDQTVGRELVVLTKD